MPALAADLSKHMKEKPKPDLSRVVMSSISGLVNNVSVKVGDIVAENTGEGTKGSIKFDDYKILFSVILF